jgi:intracellular sulfur oxidation DsrE/DsrF family protein
LPELSFFVAFKSFPNTIYSLKLIIMPTHENDQTSRRGFLGSIATGAAAMGLATLSPLQQLHASPNTPHIPNPDDPAEQVFKNLKGKHRIVFDVVEPVWMMPFAWPRVFLLTNMATGTTEKDNNVVVILRHNAIPYAFENRLWTKYGFADVFGVKDGEKKAVTSNVFWKPAKGTYKIPGFGVIEIGINELQDSGVQFVVCNAAMTVFSAAVAEKMNMKAEDVYNDWKTGILPGITPVPSGVWAVGRAQENKCAYCFAG